VNDKGEISRTEFAKTDSTAAFAYLSNFRENEDYVAFLDGSDIQLFDLKKTVFEKISLPGVPANALIYNESSGYLGVYLPESNQIYLIDEKLKPTAFSPLNGFSAYQIGDLYQDGHDILITFARDHFVNAYKLGH
jgi:hypothetical protein